MRFQLHLASIALCASSALALPTEPRSIFDHTSHVTSSIVVAAPLNETIAALQNFTQMIDLNPLVISSVQDPSNPNVFTVTDKLSLLFGLSTDTTYHSVFTATGDGMTTNTTASAGVALHNDWVAEAVEGGTNVTETDTVTSNFLLSPFIDSEIKTSHGQLLQAFAAQLGGEVA